MKNIRSSFVFAFSLLLTISISLFMAGCAKAPQKPAPPPVPDYALIQKEIFDNPDRNACTARIIINFPARANEILRKALADIQAADPTIRAVIIWGYNNRAEIQGSFTVGKLEWTADGKMFTGRHTLQPNPWIDLVVQPAANPASNPSPKPAK